MIYLFIFNFTGEIKATHHSNASDRSRRGRQAPGYVLAYCLEFAPLVYSLLFNSCVACWSALKDTIVISNK